MLIYRGDGLHQTMYATFNMYIYTYMSTSRRHVTYIHKQIYIHIHVHVHTHIHIHIHIHADIQRRRLASDYVCPRLFAEVSAHVRRMCMYTKACVCIHASIIIIWTSEPGKMHVYVYVNIKGYLCTRLFEVSGDIFAYICTFAWVV